MATRLVYLALSFTFPVWVAFKAVKLRWMALPTPTCVNNIPGLVIYPSNVASATTIVTNDVAKNSLFVYDITEDDINNISAYKRGAKFKASTPAAAPIKNLIPNVASARVYLSHEKKPLLGLVRCQDEKSIHASQYTITQKRQTRTLPDSPHTTINLKWHYLKWMVKEDPDNGELQERVS